MRIACALMLSIGAQAAIAEPAILSAPAAFEALQNQELVLIDIRSPAEWAETGVAQGAVALSMHSQDFGPKLSALFAAQPASVFGLICATGGRTSYVVDVLEKNGYLGVIDVSEGMLGNVRSAGWIARGLPVVSADVAIDAYTQAVSN